MKDKIPHLENDCQAQISIVELVRNEIRRRKELFGVETGKTLAAIARVKPQDISRLIGKKKVTSQMRIETVLKVLCAVGLLQLSEANIEHLSYLTKQLSKVYEFIHKNEKNPDFYDCIEKLKTFLL